MNFGTFMGEITPTWKMRKLHLWWYHEVRGNAFRRICAINRELFEKDAKTYYCNFCQEVVFKGSLKYGIVLNCPHCGRMYDVHPDYPDGFHKLELINRASSRKDKINKDSKLIG